MEGLLPPRSSPGVSLVQLADCIEQLLKFILSSCVDRTLEIDLGLSEEYCSNLLRADPSDGNFDVGDVAEGMPHYPLYKSLTSALYQCITSRAFKRTSNKLVLAQEDESFKQKEHDWNNIILEKGSELTNVLKTVGFELHVQEPFFSQLRDGTKTIEGRCAVGDYNKIGPGSLLLLNKCFMLEVQDVKKYASFYEMLEMEDLLKVLPGIKGIEEGVQIYQKFYTEEKEKANGVLAICVSIPATQPYLSLARIICELSYEGIGTLLGLKHTVGTLPESLPPPRSALLSSFMMLQNPNVKGSTLTKGARALAKHVNRSSDGWWGSFQGNVHRISGAIHGRWPFQGMEALEVAFRDIGPLTFFSVQMYLLLKQTSYAKANIFF
ncbi:PREDICTED: uncharacterized protein LOC104587010 isoform X2 [Nelumbo nucifera]|uniref:Uncharacterized protein LOC104587010 isoform X2 n=1 Tax=Nelumbo nucifera TaxID=4432 RepID=A0A1U7Z5K3_NELNU|nr:PREDICTED: uncharacterized protein LOC104587010 isoform X2 [Nelumbo nucifera]